MLKNVCRQQPCICQRLRKYPADWPFLAFQEGSSRAAPAFQISLYLGKTGSGT